MKCFRMPLVWIGILLTVITIYGMVLPGKVKSTENLNVNRPDAISIQSMKQFGDLERPKVLFLHDKHTDSILNEEKDCTICHLVDQNRLSLKFKRLKDNSKTVLMDIYHDNCIGCHQNRVDAKEKAGPVTCGECHIKSVSVISRDPMGFDKSLHYRHLTAAQNKCERCHHEYDKTAKKIFYAKGKEGSCRYCHRKIDGETGMRFQTASHLSCIQCHREKIKNGKTAGPIHCRGCHDKDIKREMKKINPVPRLERNQPDMIFIKRFNPEQQPSSAEYRMDLVPFDHRRHEDAQQTCRICHHEALTSCTQCHSMTGSEKGNYIKLEQAMHQNDSHISCVGCHQAATNHPQCNGCHRFIEQDKEKAEAFCKKCHMGTIASDEELKHVLNDNNKAGILLKNRAIFSLDIDAENVPDIVSIKSLEDKYEAVEFPHGKIVQALIKNIKDNPLAGYFHNGTEKICQGCHHNSPAGKKPPRCGSCHGNPFDENKPFVPGLMGAYHQQCMGCHREMRIDKPVSTDCTACHQEKKIVSKK